MSLKIGNKTLSKKNTRTVTFYRGEEAISLVVGPLPPKYIERLRNDVLPWPEPPRKAVETKPGIFLYEGEGKNRKVVFQEDDKDPAYREALSLLSKRYTAAKILAYTAHDSSFSVGPDKPTQSYKEDPEAWRQYLDVVYSDLTDETTGLTEAEITLILDEGEKTELAVDIDEAKSTF
jgi:hypothetical protein